MITAEGKFESSFRKFEYCLIKICQKFSDVEECYPKFADTCLKLTSLRGFPDDDPLLSDKAVK